MRSSWKKFAWVKRPSELTYVCFACHELLNSGKYFANGWYECNITFDVELITV